MKYPSLLWLGSTLLLCACFGMTCDNSSTRHAGNSPTESLQSPVPNVLPEQAINLELDGPEVLLVLDPNGVICWEKVDLDAFTNATLLHWLYRQHDVLTTSDSDTTGEPVQASQGSTGSLCQSRSGVQSVTFRSFRKSESMQTQKQLQ